jgi:hypothetical protein
MDHKQKLEVYRQLTRMPEHAIEWLTAQERVASRRYTRGSRQVIEYLLYRRDCPKINVALAEYATYVPVLRRLFRSSSKALRLAVLSNANVGPGEFSFDTKDTALTKEDVISLIDKSHKERDAFDCYFSNEHIPREVVTDIIERKNPFDSIDDEKLLLIVATLANNPIISHIRDETRLDWYAEYSYYRLNMALLDLYIKAPRDIRWAGVLEDILHKLYIPFLSKDFSIEQVSSWVIESNIEEKRSEETGNVLNRFGSSDYYLRHQMAGVIFLEKPAHPYEILPDDSAIRTAYYICCKPGDLFGARVESDGFQYPSFSMEEGFYDADEDAREIINKVNEYFSLDGNDFIDCLIRNKAFWRKQAGRDFLNSLAWKKAEDPSSYMDIRNNYRMIEKDMMKLHPEYFEDDPFENVTEQKSDRRLVEDTLSEVKDLRKGIADNIEKSLDERTSQQNSELQLILGQVKILQGRVLFLILLVALLIGAFFF